MHRYRPEPDRQNTALEPGHNRTRDYWWTFRGIHVDPGAPFSNDELAVILAARRATALPRGEAPPGEASSGDDGDWKMVTGDEPAGAWTEPC